MTKPLLLALFAVSACTSNPNAETAVVDLQAESTIRILPLTDSLGFTSGITVLFEDSRGRLWIGSKEQGLAVYTDSSLSFYTADEHLIDSRIFDIQEAANGTIVIRTAEGVSIYDGQEFTNTALIQTESVIGDWSRSEDDIWLTGGTQEGVYRYDGANLEFLNFPKLPKTPGNTYVVTDVTRGKEHIWLATYPGVIGYDGHEFTLLLDSTLGNEGKYTLHSRSVLEDSKGRLWIGNNGIGVLLHQNDSTFNFSQANGLIHPFSKLSGAPSPSGTLEHVFAIAEDQAGNIWFGDRDTQLWRYDNDTIINYSLGLSFPESMIWTIYCHSKGRVLIGTMSGEIYEVGGAKY